MSFVYIITHLFIKLIDFRCVCRMPPFNLSSSHTERGLIHPCIQILTELVQDTLLYFVTNKKINQTRDACCQNGMESRGLRLILFEGGVDLKSLQETVVVEPGFELWVEFGEKID